MARIFISHSSLDDEPAARMKAWLKAQGFENAFLDKDKATGIPPGADWEKTLYREVEQSQAVVIIQTPNWLASKWCFAEFTQARALGKAIFPAIEAPTGDTLISPDIQALNLLGDREGGLERLKRELVRIALDAQGGFPWDPNRPPFPGLLAFQEEDAAVFFGRDDDIRRLIERLDARRAQGGAKLIALLGSSGSGKSSLLRAGVIPRLKRAGRNWVVIPPMRPRVHPVDELASALAAARNPSADWAKVRDDLLGRDPVRALDEFARSLRGEAQANEAQVLIPIDQAEELFGVADPNEARRFLAILSQALSESLPFMAVMTIRSDFLGQLQSAAALTARFEEFSLGPMPLARVAQIIEGPARVAGLKVDEAFVQQAASDAETEDALPLLAFALRQLWDQLDKSFSLHAYKALGDEAAHLTPLENAVRKAADAVLAEAKPTDEERTALREAFVPALVRVNDQGEYVRRPAPMDALPAKSHGLLKRLADARLLILRDEGVVEVAHEALLRKWPWLKEQLDAERVFLIGKQQLEQDLRDWQAAADKDKADALLTGLKLTRDRAWLVEHPTRLTADERAFIQASIDRDEAERRRNERRRRITTAVSLATAMALTLLLAGAVWQWSKAQESERQARAALREARAALSGQIAVRAQALLDQNPRLSSLLAVAALNITERAHDPPTVAARETLLRVLASSGGRVVGQLEDPISTVVLSPNGRWLVTVGHNEQNESTARLWDLTAQNPLAKPRGIPGVANPVAISSNSHWLVTGGPDRVIRIWDLTSPNPADRSVSLPGPIENIGISGDSRWLVTARSGDPVTGFDGDGVSAAQLWDLESPDATRHPVPLVGHRRAVTAIAFSPDGRWLATGSGGCHSHTGDRDEVVRLWDLKASNFQETPVLLAGHRDPIDGLAFSPDSHLLVSGSGDSSVSVSGQVLRDRWSSRTCGGDHVATIWDLTTKPAPEGSLLASGIPIAVSVDSRRLVTLENDRVRLWDLAAKSNRAEPVTLSEGGVPLHVSVIAVSSDHRWLATGSGNKARLWDLAAGDPLSAPRVLRGHEGDVDSVAFSIDGQAVVTGSEDKTVRLWNMALGGDSANPIVIRSDHEYMWVSSPDDRRLITNQGPLAMVWDLTRSDWLTAKPTVLSGHTGPIFAAAFSSDNHWIATGSNDGTARLWDMTAANNAASPILLKGHKSVVSAVAFSADRRWLATGSFDETARLWNLAAPDPSANPFILGGQEGPVFKLGITSDSRWLISQSEQHIPSRVWSLAGSGIGSAPMILRGSGVAAASSPDGRWLITLGSERREMQMKELSRLEEEKRAMLAREHSTDEHQKVETQLASIRNQKIVGEIRLWNLADRDPGATSNTLGSGDGPIAISPGSRWLVASDEEGVLQLWNLKAGDPGATRIVLRGHVKPVNKFAFSADERWLLSGSYDGTARLWDLKVEDIGASSRILFHDELGASGVAISSDERWLAISNYSGTKASIWELTGDGPSSTPVTLLDPEKNVENAAFSGDSRWLITRNHERGTINLWRLQSDELKLLACGMAGRNMTTEEWANYLPGQPYTEQCAGFTTKPS